MHLRRIRDYLTSRRGVSFAEVGHQALWQRSRVLVAVAASDVQWLQETLERVREYLDGHEWVLTSYETEVMDVDS